MVFGLSHVIVPVSELTRARAFYVDHLGFPVLREDSDSVDLEASTTALRLKTAAGVVAPVALRLRAVSIRAVLDRVTALGIPATRPTRSSPPELVARIHDPDGNQLEFWRPLSEDELDERVALPKKRPWETEAEELMQSLLSEVPALFRALARTGGVAEAEYLTPPGSSVGVEGVVRAFIRSTPRLVRSRVRGPLEDRGFDLERYESDFEV